MIFYRPTDGDPQTTSIIYHPKTCFIITQLGDPVPEIILSIRKELTSLLNQSDIKVIDANSEVTGRDFLLKIWKQILSVPLGIAIVYEGMNKRTLANIFYELGMMHAYGKETLIIKSDGFDIPSDFVRTEYVNYDDNFSSNIQKYIDSFFEQAEYYAFVSNQLDKNPLLAIDYLKRAYLITGDNSFKQEAKNIFEVAALEDRARNSVEMLLINF